MSSVDVQSNFGVFMNICRFLYNCWFKSWILLESLKDRVDACIGGLDRWFEQVESRIDQLFDQIRREHKFFDLMSFCRKRTMEIGSVDVYLTVCNWS